MSEKLMSSELYVHGNLELVARRLEHGQRSCFSKHGILSTIVRAGSTHCVYFMNFAPK